MIHHSDNRVSYDELVTESTTNLNRYFSYTILATGEPELEMKFNPMTNNLRIQEKHFGHNRVSDLVIPLSLDLDVKRHVERTFKNVSWIAPLYKNMDKGVLEIVFRVSLYEELDISDFDIKNKEHEAARV